MRPLMEFSLFWFGSNWKERFGISSSYALAAAAVATVVELANLILTTGFLLVRGDSLNFLRLHYTVGVGVDWVASWYQLLIFPGLGLGLLLVNALASGFLSHKSSGAGVWIWLFTLMIEVAILVASTLAILINI